MNETRTDTVRLPAPPLGDAPSLKPGWCLNCDAQLHGPYCAKCGQRNTSVSASLRSLAGEFADEFLSLDSRLLRSLLALLFRPGHLTRQYLVGRRERYVRPLRLYIVASLLFFFAVPFAIQVDWEGTASLRDLFVGEEDAAVGDAAQAEGGAAGGESLGLEALGEAGTFHIAGQTISLVERAERIGRLTPQQLVETLLAGFERYLPRIMFILLPVFALILKVLYLRRRWYYAEHFIFALHFHAFAFALFFLVLVLPIGGWKGLLVLWGVVYLALAMHQVYRQSFWKTGAKFLLLTGSYSVLLMLAVASSVLLSMLLV
jgi:hypothetical protein